MNSKLLFTALCSIIMTFAATGQYAHFPFDTDEKDVMTNINAIASDAGVSYVTDETRGSVMELDGTAGYVTLGTNAYDFSALTYNIWFQWNTAVADQWWVRIWDFGIPSDLDPHPGNHDVNFLTCYQDGLLSWHIHSVNWTDGQDTVLSSLEPLALNTWYMLTATHDGDSARLYLNAELQASKATDLTPDEMVFTDMYLGRANWPDPLFTGRMDDFRIYNSVLSAEDITDIYEEAPPSALPLTELETSVIYAAGNSLVIQLDTPASDAALTVYTIQGATIMAATGLGSETQVNTLPQGIYVVRVINNGNINVEKVVIR
jgi:hypothetical protein